MGRSKTFFELLHVSPQEKRQQSSPVRRVPGSSLSGGKQREPAVCSAHVVLGTRADPFGVAVPVQDETGVVEQGGGHEEQCEMLFIETPDYGVLKLTCLCHILYCLFPWRRIEAFVPGSKAACFFQNDGAELTSSIPRGSMRKRHAVCGISCGFCCMCRFSRRAPTQRKHVPGRSCFGKFAECCAGTPWH